MTRPYLVALIMLLTRASYADPAWYVDDDGNSCYDSTDVVGQRHCRHYGAWAVVDPYVFVDYGINSRHFATHAANAIARSTSPVTGNSSDDSALMFDMRIGFGLTHATYLALETEFGDLGATGMGGKAGRTDGRDVIVGGLAVFGIRADLTGVAISGEIGAGGRSSDYPIDSPYRGPYNEFVVEGRVRADIWLGPWFTVGAVLGKSLITKNEYMAGILIGVHSRSFGGD